MLLITPYKTLGELSLNSPLDEDQLALGKGAYSKVELNGEIYINGFYSKGYNISYLNGLSCFIGCFKPNNCLYETFLFEDKSYDDILNFFDSFPGHIYVEKDTSVISEYLGISTYFEDDLQEVGIFTDSYLNYLSEDLSI